MTLVIFQRLRVSPSRPASRANRSALSRSKARKFS
jgi:hypothetical protein